MITLQRTTLTGEQNCLKNCDFSDKLTYFDLNNFCTRDYKMLQNNAKNHKGVKVLKNLTF